MSKEILNISKNGEVKTIISKKLVSIWLTPENQALLNWWKQTHNSDLTTEEIINKIIYLYFSTIEEG